MWLDQRDRVLCNLSVEDGEWPEPVKGSCRKQLKRMGRLMKLAEEYAEQLGEDGLEGRDIVWKALDELAGKYGYTRGVNWSIEVGQRG